MKIKAILQLLRLDLTFAAAICVVIGAIIAYGGLPPLRAWLLGGACGFFISASAIILNDYFDLEVDRINAPERPLPSGAVSPLAALRLTAVTALAGLAAAFALGTAAFGLCLIFWVIGFLYNWKFKTAGLAGNLMVSFSVAVTFLLGGMAVGDPWNKIVWCLALTAFCLDLGEEIAGDAMDMEGDKARASQSIAIVYGKPIALRLAAALFGLAILISLLPIFFQWLGMSYLVTFALVDLAILVFTIRLVNSPTPQAGRQAMRGIYLSGSLGIAALIVVSVM